MILLQRNAVGPRRMFGWELSVREDRFRVSYFSSHRNSGNDPQETPARPHIVLQDLGKSSLGISEFLPQRIGILVLIIR